MGTKFWEIASLFLQIVQMGYYLTALDKYKDKLEELATWLCDTADINKAHYKSFRDRDPAFYEYYQTLPGYSVCDTNVRRGKGAAFFKYGAKLRRTMHAGRGYTPLANVTTNIILGSDAVSESSVHRATTYMNEQTRVDGHVLARWDAIVSAPIGQERYQAAYTNQIIDQSFKTIKALGQGFNSAASAFGTSLYRVLT